jgi:hypothetical protein
MKSRLIIYIVTLSHQKSNPAPDQDRNALIFRKFCQQGVRPRGRTGLDRFRIPDRFKNANGGARFREPRRRRDRANRLRSSMTAPTGNSLAN